MTKTNRYPDAPPVPKTVLINPVIRPLSDEIDAGWEGCLSIPGMRGIVPRWAKIHYEGFDQFGNKISRNADGFHARVVQHECDHLDGILYPFRIDDLGPGSAFPKVSITTILKSWTTEERPGKEFEFRTSLPVSDSAIVQSANRPA